MTDDSDVMLFGEWLMRTQILQRMSYGKDPAQLEGAEREMYVLVNAYAAEDEIHELTDELSWKPWASAKFFNREQLIGEAVDALHFIGNILVAAKCTDKELNERYLQKMEKNRKRMAEGYTGLDKCMICRRAMDDVGRSVDHAQLCQLCVTAMHDSTEEN